MKHMNHLAILCTALLLLVAGCAITPPPVIESPVDFDPSEVEYINQPGENTVTGYALLRQRGGGVVTCAGVQVSMTPNSSYARFRMKALYKNLQEGYFPAFLKYTNAPRPGRPDPDYLRISLSTVCDAQGNFKFTNVPDGEYYVTASVIWEAGTIQGGHFMKFVKIKGGETREVIFTQ